MLVGGPGADTLNGGTGYDTYIWRFRENPTDDIVVDEDHKGFFLFQGATGKYTALAGGFEQDPNDSGLWRDLATGEFVLTHHSPWTLALPDGTTVSLGDSLPQDSFGIHRFTEPTASAPEQPQTTGDPIRGDLHPTDFNPDPEIVEYHYDLLGNVVNDGTADPDRADILYDSAGSDSIVAGGRRQRLRAPGLRE